MPDEPRSLAIAAAQHRRWAKCTDRTAATAPARKAFQDRFEKQVDPNGDLDPAERAKRAAAARSAYFQDLGAKSAKARAARKAQGL